MRSIAIRIGLVDKPDHRKKHQKHVPLVGGLAIGFTLILILFLFANYDYITHANIKLMAGGYVLLIIGAIDDKKDIRASYKLAVQMLCSLIIAVAGYKLTSLHGILGIYDIPLLAQYVLSVVLITGVINAFNLMDGIDGLAGGLTLIGFLILATISHYVGHEFYTLMCVIIIGSLIGFLKFNVFGTENKIFMGDAGSLFLGFLMIGIAIDLINIASMNVIGAEIIWLLPLIIAVFIIPVADSLRVYFVRIKNGNSPFKADRSHIHHLFLELGLQHTKVTFIISMLSLSLVIMAFLLHFILSLDIIILGILSVLSIMYFILNINKQVNLWQEKIKQIESYTT
jgi:UDP-GlcNAc:undecaprenyl-phosphate GlcNAc-1-phosphate transferase